MRLRASSTEATVYHFRELYKCCRITYYVCPSYAKGSRELKSGLGRGMGILATFEFRNARCIAVDINGTLMDGYGYTAWEDVLEKGLGLTRKENSNPRRSWLRALTGLISFEEMVAEAYDVRGVDDIRAKAYAVYMGKLRLRDGCLDLLESLGSRYNLVVCSDTSGVTKVIAKEFDLERYFSKLFYSCDVGYVKNDLRFWKVFLSSFPKMKSEEFIMIGDNSGADIRWPRTLGMGTILVESTELPQGREAKQEELNEPHVHAEALDDICRILLE